MSPTHLTLFPAPTGTSRKTSLRRIRTDNIPNAAGEINMKGVAFQVVSNQRTATVEPAAESIKHSLFCDPPPAPPAMLSPESAHTAGSASSTQGPLRRQLQTQGRSSPVTNNTQANAPSTGEDDLSPLPTNTYFNSVSPPKRSRSTHLKRPIIPRPNIPNNIATAPQPRATNVPISPVDEKSDNLSPLPDKTRLNRLTSPSPQAEVPVQVRSVSESPNSGASIRSIFPVYDPSRPMDRQSYYPSERASASPPPYMRSKVAASPVERYALKRHDSGVGLVDGYEHIPAAAHADLETLWKASCEEFPVAGRKVQFGLYQPRTGGKSLAIGTSIEDLIYTMERDLSNNSPGPKQFVVKKLCPTAPHSASVSQLVLPTRTNSDKSSKVSREEMLVFPHAAGLNSISSVMNCPEAHHIAAFDPTATSPEAARLAQDALTAAQAQYGCNLIKRWRKTDSLGAVTAHYDLRHPLLGTCAVTVTKSISATSTTGPRAKISFHHPSATQAAIAADTMNLAFLDFAHDACVLDIPGLLALNSHYVIDTILCALLAVALIENDALVAESVVFEAPPKTPIKPTRAEKKAERRASKSSSSTSKFKRAASKEKQQPPITMFEEADGEQVELPGLARGALKVMEFGFKTAAFVIITGIKVSLKVGTGVVERVNAAAAAK